MGQHIEVPARDAVSYILSLNLHEPTTHLIDHPVIIGAFAQALPEWSVSRGDLYFLSAALCKRELGEIVL